jgi:hypothetical protein
MGQDSAAVDTAPAAPVTAAIADDGGNQVAIDANAVGGGATHGW